MEHGRAVIPAARLLILVLVLEHLRTKHDAYPMVIHIARRTLSTARASLEVLNVMAVPSPLAKHTRRRWLMLSSFAPINKELISKAGNARPAVPIQQVDSNRNRINLPMTSASIQGML